MQRVQGKNFELYDTQWCGSPSVGNYSADGLALLERLYGHDLLMATMPRGAGDNQTNTCGGS